MPKTTCRKLYAGTPERVITGNDAIRELSGCYYNHLPEIPGWGTGGDYDQDRVEVRVLAYVNFDGRRYWQLATVWYRDELEDGPLWVPFMVIQNAGREGDDHSDRFVTDSALYAKAVRYILSRTAIQAVEETALDEERSDLDFFYGDTADTAAARVAEPRWP